MERKDLLGLGRSDPYLQITGQPYADKKPVVIFKSETIKSNSNPDWKPFKLDVTVTGGLDSPLLVEVFDDDYDSKPDFIGSCHTTLRELACFKTSPKFFLINKAKDGGLFYHYSGILIVCDATAIPPPKPKVEEKKVEVAPPQPQLIAQQPYIPQGVQPVPANQQNFTISVSTGPGGFNISMGTNTSQLVEPKAYPQQPSYPGVHPVQNQMQPGQLPYQPMPGQQMPGQFPPGIQPLQQMPNQPGQPIPQQPPQQPHH